MKIDWVYDERLRDRNGKVVMLGDKVSFDGRIGTVVWWTEQERHYIEFEKEKENAKTC